MYGAHSPLWIHSEEAMRVGGRAEAKVRLVASGGASPAVEAEHQRRWLVGVVALGDADAVRPRDTVNFAEGDGPGRRAGCSRMNETADRIGCECRRCTVNRTKAAAQYELENKSARSEQSGIGWRAVGRRMPL